MVKLRMVNLFDVNDPMNTLQKNDVVHPYNCPRWQRARTRTTTIMSYYVSKPFLPSSSNTNKNNDVE